MRGRKPKPTVTHQIFGTYRADRHGGAHPEPARELPTCPDWLDESAKLKWVELVPQLSDMGVLTVVDGDALACYCQAWAEFQQATQTLAAEGRTVTRGTGGKCSHPAVAQQRTAWRAIRDFAALFGLDPSSRSRLHIEPQDESDPFLDLLGRRRQFAEDAADDEFLASGPR